jgi:LmbE family N-acetylglucosaminyl deacetylase
VRRLARAILSAALIAALPGSIMHVDANRPVISSHELFLQIVAHEDDDLFFMNPDIERAIASGAPTVTVYLTAGQMTGDGPTPQVRARNRQRGVQNAYAAMAGVLDSDDSSQAEWHGAPWSVGGRVVERYTLRARSNVQLVFLNLADGTLADLHAGRPRGTIVPAEQHNVTTRQQYSRSDVVTVLRAIMEALRPTVLRSQDPDPDRRRQFRPDHTDHVAAAQFSREAAAGYNSPYYEVSYRNYNIIDAPPNLGIDAVRRKVDFLRQYARYDDRVRALMTSHRSDESGWAARMYRRWCRETHGREAPPEWLLMRLVQRCSGRFRRNANRPHGAAKSQPELLIGDSSQDPSRSDLTPA